MADHQNPLPPRASLSVYHGRGVGMGAGTEKMGRRLQHALDEASAVAQMARELSAALTGISSPDGIRETAPPSSKGIFANIDHQTAQIEKRLEETRAALENIRAQI